MDQGTARSFQGRFGAVNCRLLISVNIQAPRRRFNVFIEFTGKRLSSQVGLRSPRLKSVRAKPAIPLKKVHSKRFYSGQRTVISSTRRKEASMEHVQEQVRMKIPAEAVDLYTRYIHGEVNRRDFLHGVKRLAIVGLSAEAIVQALMPNYALGQRVRKDDERIKVTYETIPSPMGNGYIRGYFVRPFSQDTRDEKPAKLPAVIVVHENRGLNPHTEDVARRFALENFMAFAPDALTTVGGYPNDDYKGGQLVGKIDPAKRMQDFLASAQW